MRRLALALLPLIPTLGGCESGPPQPSRSSVAAATYVRCINGDQLACRYWDGMAQWLFPANDYTLTVNRGLGW